MPAPDSSDLARLSTDRHASFGVEGLKPSRIDLAYHKLRLNLFATARRA